MRNLRMALFVFSVAHHDAPSVTGIIAHMKGLPVQFTPSWHTTFPGGHIGLLQMGPVDNHRRVTPLDAYKPELEASLRVTYAGMSRADLQELPVLQAYKTYYRRFKKTYHVQLQLESVVWQGKSLPSINPLVDACFAAELKTHLLTASHDVDKLGIPVTIDAATGQETFTTMNGQQQQTKANDMMMTAVTGVVCTIIYGQDRDTAVTPATQNVLYLTYAPAGITPENVAAHHQALIHNVQLFAPDVVIQQEQIVSAMG